MDLSRPLATGRTAEVFALDGHRVLRRYLGGEDAAAEAAVMAYAHSHGYPVPAVEYVDGPVIVMERIDGPTMLELLVERKLDPVAAGTILGELHTRLHALPSRPGAGSASRVLHLDLHPGNVMIDARGPKVIDWCNAADGDPDLDVAVSALVLSLVVAGGIHPLAREAAQLLRAFLAAAAGRPERQLAAAVRMRRADPHLEPAEIDLLERAASTVRAAC